MNADGADIREEVGRYKGIEVRGRREAAPYGQGCNFSTMNKYLVMSPRWGSTPRETD
jgi:hypothetical protein